MIHGNTKGIKEFLLNELNKLYDVKIEKGKIINEEIATYIAEFSSKINKEINLTIDRNGNISEISIGDSSSVQLPIMDIFEKKLSAKRIVHTHPNGNPQLSNVDISALLKLKLDCIVAIGVIDEKITGFSAGFCNIENDILTYDTKDFKTISELENYDYLTRIREVEKNLRKKQITEDDREFAILVGIDSKESLEELRELAFACNVEVVGEFLQKRQKADNLFLIGPGKASELSVYRQVQRANLIIFDEELSGLQTRNLEEVTSCKVIDRTTLILEIFSRRAKSKEAKIQVELAQLKYRSNRLIGFGNIMSRLGGGIGTKGPGEKKLEIDRRRIKENITFLKKELEHIRKTRLTQREKREDSGIAKISLVGYTNVGKSTLRNLLVSLYASDNTSKKEGVFVENMLFATLDTTTRSINLPDKRVASLTDTVGFIKKLPHDLIEAFKSTLEEVIFSDLIIHVVDAASDSAIEQITSVETVLKELDAFDKPMILALNKCDIASEENINSIIEAYKNYNIVEISAAKEINIDKLINEIITTLPQTTKICTYLIPYTETDKVAYLHRNAIINSEEYQDEGLKITAVVNSETYNRLKNYIVK